MLEMTHEEEGVEATRDGAERLPQGPKCRGWGWGGGVGGRDRGEGAPPENLQAPSWLSITKLGLWNSVLGPGHAAHFCVTQSKFLSVSEPQLSRAAKLLPSVCEVGCESKPVLKGDGDIEDPRLPQRIDPPTQEEPVKGQECG